MVTAAAALLERCGRRSAPPAPLAPRESLA